MSGAPVSLVGAVLDQVVHAPTRAALVDADGGQVDWAGLVSRTGALAGHLAAAGVRAGDRVAVRGGRSVATVLAVLGVLRAGATYCVVDPGTPPARWARLRDELASSALVEADATDGAEDGGLPVLAVPGPGASAPSVPPQQVDPSVPAYVMFTSGSTGRPKGVVVGHASVHAMVAAFDELAPRRQQPVGTLLARPAFDVSVWEIFSVLTRGGTLHVPGPDVLADGETLWDDVVRRRVTSAYVPPGLLASFADAAGRHTGPAPALDRLLVGVEPIPAGVPATLLRAVPGLRVVNGYGPTETTVCATLHLCAADGDPHRRTPIGKAVRGSTVTLVDPLSLPVPRGETGEVVVSGQCLALGYLRTDDEAGRFVEGPHGRSYRTGDLARELPGGELEFVGRTDDQVKVNGVRVEPGELEHALAGAPGVRRAVVLVPDEDGVRRLVACVEGEPVPSTTAVRSYLEAELPPHLLPARVLAVERFPLTGNGKVDTAALLVADGHRPVDGPAYAPPTTPTERELAGTCARVLALDLVGLDDDLFWLGASSLDVLRVCVELRERGLRCTPAKVARGRTVRALAAALDDGAGHAPGVAAPTEPGTYPTTRGQQGLWAWRELHPGSDGTTVVHAVRWEPARDVEQVRRALEAVVHRQEALRTTFEVGDDGRPLQRVHAPGPVGLAARAVADDAAVGRRVEELRGRRLEVRESAWDAELLVTPESSTLVLVADHLVMDGESAVVLERELEAALQVLDAGGVPSTEPVPGPVGVAALPAPADADLSAAHWREVLASADGPPVLPGPVLVDPGPRRSADLSQELPERVWGRVRALARSESTTPVVVVLALLDRLVARRSGSRAPVCLAVSRRAELGLDAAVGNAVNIVPVPVGPATGTFAEHVRVVRELVASAVHHAGTPFEDLVAGASGRPPVPGLVLAQHVTTPSQRRPARAGGARPPRPVSRSVHGLAVFVEEPVDGGGAVVDWAWDDAATLPDAVPHLAAAFAEALAVVAAHPGTLLDDLPYLAADEERLIREARGPVAPRDPRTVVDLVDAQVRARPAATAVRWPGGSATYAEIDVRATRIASLLGREVGDRPVGVVAVVLEKGPDLVAALLAVLRAGGAYLPLDPAHAPTRLPEAVSAGRVSTCLTRSDLLPAPPPGLRVVPVEAADGSDLPPANPARLAPDHLAYVMPTSGSTGTPHLVGVPHRAVVRLVAGNEAFPLGPSDRTVLVANSSFDAATFELWGALCNGGTVVVADPADLEDAGRLCRLVEREGVTAAFFTVTLFARLLDAEPQRLRGVRHLLVGGEAVPPRLVDRALEVVGPGVLVNGYGPTENTTFSCVYRVHSPVGHLRTLPLGGPVGGSGVRVLDASSRPVPVGVPGEIVVTGAGLAVGYLDDPVLTAERFFDLPGEEDQPAYRTGDLGRLLPGGEVEYLGRIDRQLKVRGFRVEPGEVEVALERHPSVRRAAVFAEDAPDERRLLAAVQADGTDGAALRSWVRGVLPSYLVPDRVVVVEHFPETANGKLDVNALVTLSRTLEIPRSDSGAGRSPRHVAGELEHQVLAVWQEALGVEGLGPDDDVFDAGASSMTVLAVAARLATALGRSVPAHLVHDCRSVGALVRRLEGNLVSKGPGLGPHAGLISRKDRAAERAAKVRHLRRRGD